MIHRGIAFALTLAACSLAGSLLLSRGLPLIDPDEGRNAEVAREMLASGDYVVPRLAGMPYLDKPPALFWGEALAMQSFGRTPLAARLPAAAAGVLTLLVLIRFAARSAGDPEPWRLVALLAAAPLFTMLSAYVIFDMPLTLCVTLVWTGLAEEIDRPAPGRRLLLFAAVAIGILLKGPVMLAWAAGGSLAAALLLRSRAPLSWLAWWPGWVLVLALAGGWFALASARHPEYPRYAFLEESLERLTSKSFHRNQPIWFAPVVVAVGALPWSLATPWWRSPARPLAAARADRVALGFLLFAILFFTFSRSKLVTYLLPALPTLAWLAAPRWSDAAGARRGAAIAGLLYGAMGVGSAAFALDPGLLGGAAGSALRWIRPGEALHVAMALLGAGAVCALASIANRRHLALAGAVALTPLLFITGWPAIERYARSQSGEPLARAIAGPAEGGRARYESCYSPGTDFLLGSVSALADLRGDETTSNYQSRYRDLLVRRGDWAALPDSGAATVLIRPASGARPGSEWVECFRDGRFAAYLRGPSRS